jgi:hypothetical protein
MGQCQEKVVARMFVSQAHKAQKKSRRESKAAKRNLFEVQESEEG